MYESEIQEIVKSYFPNLKEESLDAFMKHASYLKSTKGTKLISEGKRHRYFYLILKGGVKSYYSKESREVCMWFAFKNEVLEQLQHTKAYPQKKRLNY